jgi:hypothetical protein
VSQPAEQRRAEFAAHRRELNRKLKMAFLAGAEERSRAEHGRGLTEQELLRITWDYPGTCQRRSTARTTEGRRRCIWRRWRRWLWSGSSQHVGALWHPWGQTGHRGRNCRDRRRARGRRACLLGYRGRRSQRSWRAPRTSSTACPAPSSAAGRTRRHARAAGGAHRGGCAAKSVRGPGSASRPGGDDIPTRRRPAGRRPASAGPVSERGHCINPCDQNRETRPRNNAASGRSLPGRDLPEIRSPYRPRQ